MTTESHRRLSIGLGVLSFVLLALLIWLFADSAMLRLRVVMADGDTNIHAQMVDDARATKDPAKAVQCLNYLVGHYPSGSKQVAGSKLDRVVERCRRSSALVIIAHLRVITGKDLGDKPEPWIEKFAEE
mgnify:CR=1 FL=1